MVSHYVHSLVSNLFFLLLISLVGINSSYANQQNINSKPLRIAVAANFTPVLKILLKDFTKNTGIKYQIISSGSGALFLQVKHGAPFDIFLSADSKRPEQLEHSGYALSNTRKTYALGQLALYTLEGASLQQTDQETLSILKNPPKRFAIANPDIAPYGKAAKETLEHLGLWQRYQPHLIKGVNIGQTFTQIHSKAVSSGFVANSQLVLNNLTGIIIPEGFHEPIQQQLIIIKTSKQQQHAKILSDFLLSAEIQRKIIDYGYAASPKNADIE